MDEDLSFRRFLREWIGNIDERDLCFYRGIGEFIFFTTLSIILAVLVTSLILSVILALGSFSFGVIRVLYWAWRSDQI